MKFAFLVGIIFAIAGGIIFVKEVLKRKKCNVSTNGTVIDIARDESRDSDGNIKITLHTIFEYNVSGNIYVKKSNFGSSNCKYHIGQEVEILYNAEKPDEYYVKGSFGSMILGAIFMICGIILIFM